MEKRYQSSVEEAVDTRRRALRLTWRSLGTRAGVSHETLRRLRAGEPVSDITEAGVEQALAWEPGSIQLIRQGMSPITKEEAEQVERWQEQGLLEPGPHSEDHDISVLTVKPDTTWSEFEQERREQREYRNRLQEQGKTVTTIQISGPDGAAIVQVAHSSSTPPSAEGLFRGFTRVFEEFNKQVERNRRTRDGRNPPPIRRGSSQSHHH